MSSSDWLEMRIADVYDRTAMSRVLFAHGCAGIHEAGDEIVAFFPASADTSELLSMVAAVDTKARAWFRIADALDAKSLHGNFSRIQVNALTIAPPWLAADLDPRLTVVIDPAMGFGTGQHPTTRGVLRLMQTLRLQNKTVADVGAGSAILSISAAKLGASRVVAIEIDPDAAGNAAENVETNKVGDRVHFLTGDARTLLPLLAPVDVILANILSSVVIDLLPTMHDSLSERGCAILSGILRDERPAVEHAFETVGFIQTEQDIEGEWWSVLISRA